MLQGFPGPLRMQWVQEDVLGRAVPFEVSAVSSPSSPTGLARTFHPGGPSLTRIQSLASCTVRMANTSQCW